MAGFLGGLADAAAGAGAFMRGGNQRVQEETALANAKQQSEIQGLQLAQGKMQLEEQTNQRNLEKALQEGYQSWVEKQKQAASMDAASASKQQGAMLDYAKRVEELGAGGTKPVGLKDAGPIPEQPTAPTEEGKASLYSHLAEIAARTPGGFRMAEELQKAHKTARDEGYLEAAKAGIRGEDPETVIEAFNKYGTMKVVPGSGYRDANGIYYAKTQDGKETSFDPRVWAVTFGLRKPDEYTIEGGTVLNKTTGETRAAEKQWAPKDYFITLNNEDGGQTLIDLRQGMSGQLPTQGGDFGVGRKNRQAISKEVKSLLGESDFSGLEQGVQERAANAIAMAQYLVAMRAVNPDTNTLMSPEIAAGVALKINDPAKKLTEEQIQQALKSYLPQDKRGEKPSGGTIDPKTATFESVTAGMTLDQRAQFRNDLEAARGNPQALRDLNQAATNNPDSGLAQKLLNELGEQAPTPVAGAGLPRPTAAPAQPTTQLPRPTPERLGRFSDEELAGMVKLGLPNASKEDEAAIRREVDKRGLVIKKTPGFFGPADFTLQKREEPVRRPPSAGATLEAQADPVPPDGPSRTQPGLAEAAAAFFQWLTPGLNTAPTSPATPSTPAATPPTTTKPTATPPATNPSATTKPSDKSAVTTKPGAKPAVTSTPDKGQDTTAYVSAQQTARAGGSRPVADPDTARRRAEASEQAPQKLKDGDLQWFIDNMRFISSSAREIYINAINKRLAHDGFGNPAMKGRRVTVDPNLPRF
jgi:hypothetical protein